jgi:uncharacterized membrane protein YqgA involved in biofilm formation
MRAVCAGNSGFGVVASNIPCMSVRGMAVALDENCMSLTVLNVIDQFCFLTR